MPEWVSITLSVLGSLGILGLIGKTIWDLAVGHVKKQQDKIKAYDKQEKEMNMRAIIKDEIWPVREEIAEQGVKLTAIQYELALDKESTVLNLRFQMKTMRDKYKQTGVIDNGDIATWKELYGKYCQMGGNHFQEWVDSWGNDLGITSAELKDIREKNK